MLYLLAKRGVLTGFFKQNLKISDHNEPYSVWQTRKTTRPLSCMRIFQTRTHFSFVFAIKNEMRSFIEFLQLIICTDCLCFAAILIFLLWYFSCVLIDANFVLCFCRIDSLLFGSLSCELSKRTVRVLVFLVLG